MHYLNILPNKTMGKIKIVTVPLSGRKVKLIMRGKTN